MNNFAISSGGLGEALERSASSLAAANNTLHESASLITAANTVVQNPEKVGNAMKTISMRIRGAKTELEDMGESTDGMVESTATLRAEIQALSGVDIMASATEFKSTYQIMDELSQKWEGLSDIAQATIVELMAGKHQGNVFASLMENFQTARDALETSLDSSGSALQEHEKWQKSLEAQILKLKASWQGLSQAFMSSDFLHGALELVIDLVSGLTKLIDTIGVIPTLLAGVGLFKFGKKGLGSLFGVKTSDADLIRSIADAMGLLGDNAGKSSGLLGKVGNSLKGVTGGANTAGGALKNVAKSLGSIITTHPYITAAVVAVTALAAAFTYQKKQAENLAKEVDEVTSKYKEQHNELKKLEDDYDTSNESSMISKYERLSKGVDGLGKNVSLTADEYSEYQGIVNKIAEQFPSLITGYDEQGNAILSCKDNIKKLIDEYQRLIHIQNQEILNNSGKIEKDFANTIENASGEGVWSNNHGFWAGMLGNTTPVSLGNIFKRYLDYDLKTDTVQNVEKLLKPNITESDKKAILKTLEEDRYAAEEIRDALADAGFDIGTWESPIDALEDAIKDDPQKVKNIVDNYYTQFDEAVTQAKSIAQAKLSEAFDVSNAISGLNYGNISEELQQIAYQTVNSLDWDFFAKLKEQGKTVEQWTTEMLNQLNSIGKEDNAEIKAAFDLKTQFNGGEISYGEYVNGLQDVKTTIEGLGLTDELESQLKISLGLDEDGIVDQYEALVRRLTNDTKYDFDPNILPDDARAFLNGLSANELSVAVDIITEMSENNVNETIDDIRAAIKREMAIQGLTFDLNLEVETAGIESVNTALAESVSATGLSSESIAALKGRYSELVSEGYDLSNMFEETSQGIHLNKKEFNDLERAYSTKKLADVESDLAEMKGVYDELGEAIRNCDDPIKKSELYNDRLSLSQKISEAATLASQYKGLTSAYNAWLAAEEAGSERDMYENIIQGFETVEDEISRGWIDDGTIKFLELLTGRTDLAGKSGKQLKEIYDSLDDTIKNTTYSISDFFTVDEDGNSTNTGVYNFLDAIGQLEEEKFGGKDVVKRDDDGNIIGFNFELAGGDEAIAEALGVSEELVQIMLRAADDAGFVVSLDGTYKQLADLQSEATAAANYLKEIGKTEFEFDFNTTDVTNLKTQLEEAHKILDNKDFWNADGTFNFDAKGATEAMTVVSTLQAKLDNLTKEQYGIGLTVEDEEFEEPLEKLQEYGRNVATLNQLKLNPKANAEEIKNINEQLEETSKYFANLDEETKIELGFEADDDWEEVKKKIESGKVTIPTTLDIQANMDKNLETLADLALLGSGLLSESEEETIRKKYKVEVEADEVDTTNFDEEVESAIGVENESFIKEKSIEIIAKASGIEDVEKLKSKLDGLDSKTVETIAKVIGQIDVEKLQTTLALVNPVHVQAIAEAIGKGDVDGLKEAIGNLHPTHVQAIAEALGFKDVDQLNAAIENLDPKTVEAVANVLGITDVDSLKTAIDNVKGKDVEVNASTSGESKLSGLKKLIDSIKSKTVTITSWFKKITSGGSTRNDSNGFNEVNGTANSDGAAFAKGTTGRAFKQGDWRTKKTETALTGELGQELVVTGNRWYTVGDSGAEFATIPKGSIVFNHKQTEELFKNGKVASNGGRGKMYANGTAYAGGSSGSGGGLGSIEIKTDSVSVTSKTSKTSDGSSKSNKSSKSSGSSGSGGSNKAKGKSAMSAAKEKTEKDEKEFEETFDWIEVKIKRLEEALDQLDQKANRTYKSWSSRNAALEDEIVKINEAINLQNSAYNQYMAEANAIGLGYEWRNKVQNGTLDISTVKDEDLAKKIKSYQEYYNKALACQDAVEDLKDKEAELYRQNFDNVVSKYDGKLDAIENVMSIMEQDIEQSRYTTHISGSNNGIYNQLINQEQNTINQLIAKKIELEQALNEAVRNGLSVNSEDYREMRNEIDAITLTIKESTTNISKYYRDMFDEISDKYDTILQGYEHTESMLNEYINQAEAKGQIVSKNYYQALINNEKQNISQLKKEQSALIKARDNAVKSGNITKYSKEWYEMSNNIDEVTRAIEEGTTSLIEYSNAMRDIDWKIFDLTQQRISDVTDEANFLIELMSNEKLFDDKGKLTDQGLATMGLRAQNYNTHMYKADYYGEEVAKIDSQLAKGYDENLEERRRELIELQRESILAAEDEKNAIRDLVEESIELELDALQDLIDKKNEALESERDLYEYQKKVKEQTKEIASLEKQMAAYSGDSSEEAKAKIQELKISLEEAKTELQETEYEKYIADQQKLLDNLYEEYSLTLGTHLDNIDGLINGVINVINGGTIDTNSTLSALLGTEGSLTTSLNTALGAEGEIVKGIGSNAASIKNTLSTEAKNVGATLSAEMNRIWSGEGNEKSVLTTYGNDFSQKSAAINTVLNNIKVSVDNLVRESNKEATQNVNAGKTQSSTVANPITNKPVTPIINNTETYKPPTNNKPTSSSGDGKPKVGDRVKFVSGQYYYDSEGTRPLGYHNRGGYVYITKINTASWATHPIHISTGKKLGTGDLGWLKKNQISGYATGKKNFTNNEIAWTQEKGEEYIIRPSDGAILTPIARGDSVLNATASGNIWNMANNPAEFIRDNLKLDTSNVPNGSNVQNSYMQNLDKVVFNFPNVKSYDEMLAAMQKDKNFERLLLSMTIDRVAGKSSLAKGKSIR